MVTKKCKVCKSDLIDIESIEAGFGPACYKSYNKELADKEFEKNQITIFEILGVDK